METAEPLLPGYPHRLTVCPQCAYSLEGLPAVGRCPECGFRYDERTFVLRGISRGTGATSKNRGKTGLLLLAGIGVWIGSQAIFFLLAISPLLAMGVGLLVLVAGGATLAVTGKKLFAQPQGESFLFAAGGFGDVTTTQPGVEVQSHMLAWTDVTGVTLERASARWYRLRLWKGSVPGDASGAVKFDAGVRCEDETAPLLLSMIEQYIQEAWNPGPAASP